MIEERTVIESDPSGNWEIINPKPIIETGPGIMQLVARSKKYLMSVVPTALVDGAHFVRLEHQIEVVFFQNNGGKMGEQISAGGIISQNDMVIENKNPEWWSEFADKYGRQFTQIADTTSPTELFSKTFPDVLEARAKRVAEIAKKLALDQYP